MAKGYEYRVDGGSPVDAGDALSAVVSGLSASTAYDLEVRKRDNAGSYSAWSSVIEGTTSAGSSQYTQDFNALTTAALHGQDSWVESQSLFTVQTGTVYEGAKALSALTNAFEPFATRAFTGITSGSFYVAIRKDHATNGFLFFKLLTGSSSISFVRMGSDGNISAFDAGSGYIPMVTGYAANTWYVVNVEFDASLHADQYRARTHNGTSWSSFTSWIDSQNSFSTVDGIEFSVANSGVTATAYFDTITDTDPT